MEFPWAPATRWLLVPRSVCCICLPPTDCCGLLTARVHAALLGCMGRAARGRCMACGSCTSQRASNGCGTRHRAVAFVLEVAVRGVRLHVVCGGAFCVCMPLVCLGPPARICESKAHGHTLWGRWLLQHGNTALHRASDRGHVATARYLALQAGIPVDSTNKVCAWACYGCRNQHNNDPRCAPVGSITAP